MEAKEAVKELLEILMQKYLAELRKDPDKKAEFMYSQFSMVHQYIRVNEEKTLKEILSLVQTAIIKLYIESNQQEKVSAFFSQFSEGSGMRAYLCLNEDEL